MVVLAAAGVVAFRYFQKKVQEYADTKPMAIEKGDASPAKLNAVQKRIDAFKDAVANQNTPQELALTTDEINTLLAGQPELQTIANRVFVFTENGHLKGKLSWPLDQFGLNRFHYPPTMTSVIILTGVWRVTLTAIPNQI